MPAITRDPLPDSTLAFLRDGYEFIPKRARRFDTDIFRTRLLLRKTICVTGHEAATLFYDESRFRRQGAAPTRLKKTLFGEGGVQGLDGERHRARKAMFMSLMTAAAIEELVALFRERWREALTRWQAREEIVLFPEVERVICRAVCAWAGVPLAEDEVDDRTGQISAMIDGSGAVGWRHWKGRRARKRAERWLMDVIGRVRSGDLEAPPDRALRVVSLYEDPEGGRLDARIAAVEVLNVLRPVVAIAYYIAFLAHALHEHPAARRSLEEPGSNEEEDAARERFVQEVRRLYPFFPLVAAVTREPFDWRGYRLPGGVRVMLDLYGTSRDPKVWDDPDSFRPERFVGHPIGAFEMVPQGGGDHYQNHRCAGEWITIAVMKEALRLLTREMTYRLPQQDLSIDLSRFPAIPRSRILLRDVAERRPGAAQSM